jgi:hypothetical protein
MGQRTLDTGRPYRQKRTRPRYICKWQLSAEWRLCTMSVTRLCSHKAGLQHTSHAALAVKANGAWGETQGEWGIVAAGLRTWRSCSSSPWHEATDRLLVMVVIIFSVWEKSLKATSKATRNALRTDPTQNINEQSAKTSQYPRRLANRQPENCGGTTGPTRLDVGRSGLRAAGDMQVTQDVVHPCEKTLLAEWAVEYFVIPPTKKWFASVACRRC